MLSKKLFFTNVVLFILAGFLFIGSVGASSEMWSQTYGGEGTEKAYSLVETSDGAYVLAGYTYPSDTEESDVWLVKTDAHGNMVWNRTYGEGAIRVIVQTSDGGYALVGRANKGDWDIYRDFLLVKTDNHGNMEWNRTYGGNDLDHAYSLVQTSDGGFALVGDTSPNLLGSPRDIWLVKTDAYGVMEWNRTYGGASYEYAYSLVETSDGGFALAGCTASFGAGHEDVWLVKTDSYGNMMWNQTYEGEAYALVQTSDGGYAIAGQKDGDFWLAKANEHGVIPEFPSWAILPLFLVATVSGIVVKRRLFHNRSEES
ncbi:MAG TPA: hypothetical protein ENN36_06030 [Candidatus Bathyarchaeota archaeon]|nr:hypothetical protein [Candidatus Bathyarchaeota archaeon]